MYDECKADGQTLPCVNNGISQSPDNEHRQLLVDTCGLEYSTSAACCSHHQLSTLVQQVEQAKGVISFCPACWKNFLTFWCNFTCSPHQSNFVNITQSVKGAVTQADYWVDDAFGTQFYDSCKDIKFSASNGYAMDFIGGGAKNWHEMAVFMGKRRPGLGSPFQIDFPVVPTEPPQGIVRMNAKTIPCNATETDYQCSCIDCGDMCPVLPPTLGDVPECKVGTVSCWGFSMVMTYLLILVVSLGWCLRSNKRLNAWCEGWYESWTQTGFNDRLWSELSNESTPSNREDYTLIDPDQTPRRYWLNTKLQNGFYRLGHFCAHHPWVVLLLSLSFVTLCSLGWSHFSIEQNPVNLWVSPSSPSLSQKNHFDAHFSPFYRTTQLFLVSNDTEVPVLSGDRLEALFALEHTLSTAVSEPSGHTFQDVCFHPNGNACVLQSITGYWQGDIANFDKDFYEVDLQECLKQPSDCLPDYQLPTKPHMVLGGYRDQDYLNAKALVVTFVLENSLDPEKIAKAEEWEHFILDTILSNVNDRPEWEGIRISYSTESSLQTELNASNNTDAITVMISYLVMFLYASLALGRFHSFSPRRMLVDSKFSLASCGILIVLFSVSSSVGLFSLTGRKTTLIIAEVIPFLVLAVGVDNIFILCHEYERRRQRTLEEGEEETIEERAARTLGKMGPSILLSSLSETFAFGLGTLVTMPAVSSFAMVASLAVFIDFLLQVTCFVACMVLDAHRTERGRADCVPCVHVHAPEATPSEGLLERICRKYYVPTLLHPKARYPICLAFLGVFMLSLALLPQLPLGLDQRIALPSDSYLVHYFNDLSDYLNVGPPVYFVVQGNLTDRDVQKKVCGRFSVCNERSVANVLEQERKRPATSYIGEPTSVWIDDYFYWLSPIAGCCRLKKYLSHTVSSRNVSHVSPWMASFQAPSQPLCGPLEDPDDCKVCMPEWNIDMETFPQGQAFLDYYDLWIAMAPDEDCPLAGKAGYGDAIVAHRETTSIETSHFRTFHTPLRTQSDFIHAYEAAHRIAHDLSVETGLEVYPYSVFYIFFEQYSYIVAMAVQLLSMAILAIFVVTSALLGSLLSGSLVMLVVIMILVDVVGVMTLWGISLNAVSLVNLIICVGISVEFCCHIARGFMVSSGSLEERSTKTMVDIGTSVSDARDEKENKANRKVGELIQVLLGL
ncbi:sterol-sensing domain of SREBP cleavage-activation-domain-containing protein [Spinellus fusiger]|nr:sterol-sensing domain of SREBP cleavage-activation-domain-containing protein [Spinellus fusiger]